MFIALIIFEVSWKFHPNCVSIFMYFQSLSIFTFVLNTCLEGIEISYKLPFIGSDVLWHLIIGRGCLWISSSLTFDDGTKDLCKGIDADFTSLCLIGALCWPSLVSNAEDRPVRDHVTEIIGWLLQRQTERPGTFISCDETNDLGTMRTTDVWENRSDCSRARIACEWIISESSSKDDRHVEI